MKNRRRSISRAERRSRKNAKRLQAWREDHPHPTPYHEWPENAPWYRDRVQTALGLQPLPSWACGRARKAVSLTVEDLAVGYWAVHCTSGKGTSGGQLRCCFEVCLDVGCHHSKAKIIFSTLMTLGLIQKTANYYVGRRGNVYEEVAPGKTAKPFVRKTAQLNTEQTSPTAPPGDMDDPFYGVSSRENSPDDLFSIPRDGSNIVDE